MLFSLVKAKGHSMEPEIKNGSFFIASKIPFIFRDPKVGDIVLFKSKNKIIIKKIMKIISNNYYIEGINKADSKKFGPIKKQEILGKITIKIFYF